MSMTGLKVGLPPSGEQSADSSSEASDDSDNAPDGSKHTRKVGPARRTKAVASGKPGKAPAANKAAPSTHPKAVDEALFVRRSSRLQEKKGS